MDDNLRKRLSEAATQYCEEHYTEYDHADYMVVLNAMTVGCTIGLESLQARVSEAEGRAAIDERQCDEMTSAAGILAIWNGRWKKIAKMYRGLFKRVK